MSYRLLPSAVGKVTGARIFIGHKSKVHPGPCNGLQPNEPCEVSTFGGNYKLLARPYTVHY